jgi:hypothetical protein
MGPNDSVLVSMMTLHIVVSGRLWMKNISEMKIHNMDEKLQPWEEKEKLTNFSQYPCSSHLMESTKVSNS